MARSNRRARRPSVQRTRQAHRLRADGRHPRASNRRARDMRPRARHTPHATRRMPHAACRMPHAACRMAHGASRMSRVACRVSRVACRVSRVACRVSRVACRVSRVACRGRRIAGMRRPRGTRKHACAAGRQRAARVARSRASRHRPAAPWRAVVPPHHARERQHVGDLPDVDRISIGCRSSGGVRRAMPKDLDSTPAARARSDACRTGRACLRTHGFARTRARRT
ncbi:glycogen branching protein [Burkholderia pseudomallei]|nr:glycogen branching protein [Burkholderia pseudomallei]CAJ3835284.1 glycogen branching protein [Burkholderia pseudomallei]CAJ4386889.1 glycogen branching protein [Burkholderia pseudomallei]CAJ5224918.1 glycogen branching protein [Burkholderia pseudomallei]CAJ6561709.1 glycogen branching protein [Burkholderia pseudomallei]